jgi:hypothetical protein
MSQSAAVVTSAVEHLRTYAASLHKDAAGCLIRTIDEESSSSSTLPKIKYWVGLLMKALQSETQWQDDGIDCDNISEVLASILRILDDTDANNLQTQTKTTKPTMRKGPTLHFKETRRRRKLPIKSSDFVEAMHESQEMSHHEFNDNDYDTSVLYLCHRAKKQKNSCVDVNISVKDVLNAKATDFSERTVDTEYLDSNREKKESKKTALLLDAAILRRDLYKFLVDVDSMNIRKCITNANGADIEVMISQMVLSLLQRIYTHPDSPSMRLSAIMAVDCLREIELSDTGYQILLDDLLNCSQALSKAIYVRFYAEIVSECDVYASPSRLLHALICLMKRTLCINKTEETCEQESQEKQTKPQSKLTEKNLLRAISQIMVRRKNILQSLNTGAGNNISKLHSSYKLMIRRISTAYDKVSCWIHSDAAIDTQEQVVSVLQAEGVLSIFCWDETDDEQSETSAHSYQSSQAFEASHPLLSLRAAHDRLGPCYPFDRLLSHSSSYVMKAQNFLEEGSQDTSCSAFSGINGDVLHNVFTFLGYRSLARASATCNSWNLASNDNRLWINLYFRKYKNAIYEEEHAKEIASVRKSGCFDKFTALSNAEERKELATILLIDSHYNWRYIFKRKYQTEKNVSKTFLRCEVIGCVAHFGKRSVNMHKKMHEKVITSRATATRSLNKLELNVFSLREKVRLLDDKAGIKQVPKDQPDAVNSLHMHSPEDTLAKVFSFLDVKDLLPPVCKMWTKILTESDVLWQSLYSTHFGLQQSPPDISQSWSTCFRATFKAEKGRRKIASYDSLGWATKLCPVVGCCTVLYNPLSYSKHILTHEQQSLNQQMQQKKKKRKSVASRARKSSSSAKA